MSTTVLKVSNVNKCYHNPDGSKKIILEDVSLELKSREIVGILGRSGSGKSTLLRLISGLLPMDSGEVVYFGHENAIACGDLAMVFQTFALFPWLTVIENVMIGLESQNIDEEEARKRAMDAISLIGLDGYECAYPKELSGGMRQRVGFARAIATEPKILLLDEAFSALDVLTATELRGEFLDLWSVKKIGLESVLMVTHNIEEAVLLCDRVLVFSSDPGKVVSELLIEIPRPRNRYDPDVRNLVDRIYTVMTNALIGSEIADPSVRLANSITPQISINKLVAVLSVLHSEPYSGHADIYKVSESLDLSIDALFPILELLQILKFATVDDGDVSLTPAGKVCATAMPRERRKIFAGHLIDNVPLFNNIRLALQQSKNRRMHRQHFLLQMRSMQLNDKEINKLLDFAVSYGCYARIFSYNYPSGIFSI